MSEAASPQVTAITPEQARAFLSYLIGWHEIGVTDGQTVDVPVCREMRAFLDGIMPGGAPSYLSTLDPRSKHIYEIGKAKCLATILRNVADHIDPHKDPT